MHVPVETVCAVSVSGSVKEKRQKLEKLHRQFAHPSSGKMKALLQDAKIWNDDMTTILEDIHGNC